MKRIKRSDDFEVTLVLKNDGFIAPPKTTQRNAVVNRALKEFASDLNTLDKQTARFVPGETLAPMADRTQGKLSLEEIMEDWQIPLMQAMVNVIAKENGDILEIGFGRGVSATMIQEHPINSHTIIECNDTVVADIYHPWRTKYPEKNIVLKHALWQDCIQELGLFDGIFFHTYPLDEDEYMQYVNASITFAEHFFEHASNHLNPGGSFTYFSNEISSLSREHQHLLLQHFSSFTVELVALEMPENVKDTWWADSMVVVKAIK